MYKKTRDVLDGIHEKVKKVRYKFVKSIPGAMKTINFIFKILENHAWDDEYNDFASFWKV